MPSTVQPYVKPRVKNPADDPVIAMSHDRRAKELKNESQRRLCSNVSGVIVQKELRLKQLEKEIQALADGVHVSFAPPNFRIGTLYLPLKIMPECYFKCHHMPISDAVCEMLLCTQEYKAQIDLLQGEKQSLEKRIAKNQEWCDTFDSSIGDRLSHHAPCCPLISFRATLPVGLNDLGFGRPFKA
eukprot:3092798-Pleurochrysis_carterae.AAC.2